MPVRLCVCQLGFISCEYSLVGRADSKGWVSCCCSVCGCGCFFFLFFFLFVVVCFVCLFSQPSPVLFVLYCFVFVFCLLVCFVSFGGWGVLLFY